MKIFKGKQTLFLLTVFVLAALPAGAQETEKTRLQILSQARTGLLEQKIFTPEEIKTLQDAREAALLAGETETAEDLGSVAFSAARTREILLLQAGGEKAFQEAWQEEMALRSSRDSKSFREGTALILAAAAGAAITAGFVFNQLSSDAFEDYTTSIVNSQLARDSRIRYESYEGLSYGFMGTSVVLSLASAWFMVTDQ